MYPREAFIDAFSKLTGKSVVALQQKGRNKEIAHHLSEHKELNTLLRKAVVDGLSPSQRREIVGVKEAWVKTLCVYEDIIFKDGVVYMVLSNGTAYSININGKTDWVVSGWHGGISISQEDI